MSSAVEIEEQEASMWQATGTDGAPNLQQVAAERLAAHRHRRASAAAQEAEQERRHRQGRELARQTVRENQRRGATAVRDLVKARYQQRESYREFLASEAERAIEQAQAEAEVAARNAHAVAEAQMQLLEELGSFNRPEPGPREEAFARANAATRDELAHALADIVLGAKELIAEPARIAAVDAAPQPPAFDYVEEAPEVALHEVSASGLTVRLFEDMPGPAPAPRLEDLSVRHGAQSVSRAVRFAAPEADEDLFRLEEEIAFRRAPEFQEPPVPPQGIPGNLIEFPRELVAPRRARPRLAEGPLRDEMPEPQLRIFEVEAFQAGQEPEIIDPQSVPDWQGMMLESATVEEIEPPVEAQVELTLPPQTAPVERRLMAAAVDAGWVGAAWLLAAAAVAEVCGPALRALTLPMLGSLAIGSLALVAVLFQLLFFSLSESTPGMRWARIGLCTFGDGNPTRRAMRRRVVSTLLAACPLGLGLAWMWLDNDRMGWHDRMSRMYPRAY